MSSSKLGVLSLFLEWPALATKRFTWSIKSQTSTWIWCLAWRTGICALARPLSRRWWESFATVTISLWSTIQKPLTTPFRMVFLFARTKRYLTSVTSDWSRTQAKTFLLSKPKWTPKMRRGQELGIWNQPRPKGKKLKRKPRREPPKRHATEL